MGTPVEGVYLAGVIASGNDANRLFIENARGHGELIVRDILRPAPASVAGAEGAGQIAGLTARRHALAALATRSGPRLLSPAVRSRSGRPTAASSR